MNIKNFYPNKKPRITHNLRAVFGSPGYLLTTQLEVYEFWARFINWSGYISEYCDQIEEVENTKKKQEKIMNELIGKRKIAAHYNNR